MKKLFLFVGLLPMALLSPLACTKTYSLGPVGVPTATPIATSPANPTSTPTSTPGTACAVFLKQWGTIGTGPGQISGPYGFAVDGPGTIYVADTFNFRVDKFDPSENYLAQWGSQGTGNGQFTGPFIGPEGIAVDTSENVYVTDPNGNRVEKFDSSGNYLTQWGTLGTGTGQFDAPNGLATDASGNVYVADYNNNRVQVFNSSGTYLFEIGSSAPATGGGNGQFYGPFHVALDTAGNIYVADTGNYRIQKFNSSGTYLLQWGSAGAGNGQFANPCDVKVDASGNVYVTDEENDRVQKFDTSGNYICQWTITGGAFGNSLPICVALNGAGDIYLLFNGPLPEIFTP